MDKPDYIKDLEKEVEKLSRSHKELKENHDADQQVHAKILGKLTSINNTTTSINYTLKGTEQDPGGLVEEVHTNTNNVQSMKRSNAKRDGMTISFSAFSAFLISALGWLLNR